MRVKRKRKQDQGLLRFSFRTFSLGRVTRNCQFSSSLFSLAKQLTVSRSLTDPTTAAKPYDSQTIFFIFYVSINFVGECKSPRCCISRNFYTTDVVQRHNVASYKLKLYKIFESSSTYAYAFT